MRIIDIDTSTIRNPKINRAPQGDANQASIEARRVQTAPANDGFAHKFMPELAARVKKQGRPPGRETDPATGAAQPDLRAPDCSLR
ncbi:hypothetical protein RmaAA213_11240 [Rhodothermus marinus]|nr:hypothetical protein RmaAA213_11240 [Rhodothermus marinus]BBM72270.1 hypothetical protein RmaAA338_11350 [Rhodothermus marinus]